MAWRPSTRSPMCVSPRSTAISARPRTSRNSLARWAAPEPTMTEQRVAPGQDERYMRIALGLAARGQIGRASCRDSGCKDVELSVVHVPLHNKQIEQQHKDSIDETAR